MKAWRKLQAIRNKHVAKEERWGKKQAKLMAQFFTHNMERNKPSAVLLQFVMPWLPVELEGPSQNGLPVTGNIWELEKT